MPHQFNSALYGVASPVKELLYALPEHVKKRVFEIRLRMGQPVILTVSDGFLYLTQTGYSHILSVDLVIADAAVIAESFGLICDFSQHTHAHEIAAGYISMRGGHRAGVAGTAVINDSVVTSMRDISSINIRVARQINNVAKKAIAEVMGGTKTLDSFIYFGLPGCGKTTYLRDSARILSAEYSLRCVLIDERGELGTGFDLGSHCDVIKGCSKTRAIEMAVRALSPQVILFDEIGNMEEAQAVEQGIICGVRIITTAHADSLSVLMKRKIIQHIVDTGELDTAVFLPAVYAEPIVYRIGDVK